VATFREQVNIAKEAAVDLSGKQYHVMRLTGAVTTNQASSRADTALWGVLQNKPKAGEFATLTVWGFTKLIAGGATTAGGPLTVNGSGRVINASSGDHVLGWGFTAAGADGDIIDGFVSQSFRLL
jgi:hypothetical protein